MVYKVAKFRTEVARLGTYVANFGASAAKFDTKGANFCTTIAKFGLAPTGFRLNWRAPGLVKTAKTIVVLAFVGVGLSWSVQSASAQRFR